MCHAHHKLYNHTSTHMKALLSSSQISPVNSNGNNKHGWRSKLNIYIYIAYFPV